ncbi:unnamed protein product [Rotaria socialis]|uniref:F-box domain-containing protein n=4 Tax=Rotaria socialis TaxID=392032 RepID=A0A818QUC9_9BILA|nr:unnamed protein product [Rotaria socialis]
MITKLDDLSVELFYEIFIYFQFHEISNIFSNLNSRFTAIASNIPFIRANLGLNGMGIAVTEFYYARLLQPNVCDRLISLCVSHTLTIDNSFWLASNLFAFINLRHLSLIDIKRSCFELMLNTSSLNTSLVIFNVHYTEYYQAAYTFKGVPEGAYYTRIFRLFPLLRVCRLRFWRYIYDALDSQIVLPLNKTFIPIETNHSNLKSFVLRECSPAFLSHLLEYHPQLEELSFDLSTPWLPDKHPLLNNYNNQVSPIDKRLVPNLRRLKITLKYDINAMELLDQLFDHDVLFSLTKFALEGIVTGPNVVSKLLSMLSHQCSYTYIIRWIVKTTIALSNTSSIFLNTLQQLKGRIPIELELCLHNDGYSIDACTLPRKDKSLYAYKYLNKNIVYVQSHWSCTLSTAVNNRLTCINQIALGGGCSPANDELLSYLLTIVSCRQITSLTIDDPFDLCQLRLLLSKMIHLRTLELFYHFNYDLDDERNKQNVIKLFNDILLCNILMSNGLKKLHFYTDWEYPDMIGIVSLIVKQLPHLEIIEINCHNSSHIPEILHIVINGLPQLNFIVFHGWLTGENEQESKMRDLPNHCKRAYRMENLREVADATILQVWLQ